MFRILLYRKKNKKCISCHRSYMFFHDEKISLSIFVRNLTRDLMNEDEFCSKSVSIDIRQRSNVVVILKKKKSE